MGERAPQHVQNIVIRDYCRRHSLSLLLCLTEYTMENSHLILHQILEELSGIDGIVMYSLLQLPTKDGSRKKIYKKILKEKKIICFAVEDMILKKKEDIDRIENIWQVKKNFPQKKLSISKKYLA